jgi:2-amino-4-hydroxy-6-hydroxymethyldihydropteridine diphosphokinase
MSLEAIIALGSNLGDRRAHLEAGLNALRELGALTPSPLVMETQDESGLGPDYLNTVARLDCGLESPCALLEALLRIELRLGRDRAAGRNAPRTLDLDLIRVTGHSGWWVWPSPGDLRSLGEQLTLALPHPRAEGRPFVQEPLRVLERRLEGGGKA